MDLYLALWQTWESPACFVDVCSPQDTILLTEEELFVSPRVGGVLIFNIYSNVADGQA